MYEKLRSLSWMDAVLIMGFMCVVVGLSLELSKSEVKDKMELVKASELSPTEAEKRKIVVEVAGGVERPGVYSFEEDERLVAALAKAGGLSAQADREWVEKNINKSRRLHDGEKIYIAKMGEEKVLGVESQEEKKVSLNEADSRGLDSLPGVGPALAERIIKYREEKGGFKNIEELKLVSGIGDKMYEDIKDKISL